MKSLREHIKRGLNGPLVRPLALSGPVLVLLIALPLLRPLRHPEEMSSDESLRLATTRALVEQQSLSLDRSYARVSGVVVQTHTGHVYSEQPPMMALFLWPAAWVMTAWGYSFDDNLTLITYILTLLGVSLPVAGAAGLIYRMGRLFELRRVWRAGLGFAVVAGSGLLSYSVVLNPHAPAATLVLASAACLIHVAAMQRDDRRAGWFALAGACSALAATLDPAAVVILVLFLLVILAMRISFSRQLLGMFLYILGAVPVISVHAAWNIPVTGDMLPASVHTMLRSRAMVTPVIVAARDEFDEEPASRSGWDALGAHALWITNATIGEHGLFSHFPVLLLGIAGIAAVMHRHWPSSTKTLAAATGAAALAILVLYRMSRLDWSAAMFASKWFIIFSPMLLFWAGAWLRRTHTPAAWGFAGTLALFSIAVGLLGAAEPMPRHGFDGYTAADAVVRLIRPEESSSNAPIAGRAP